MLLPIFIEIPQDRCEIYLMPTKYISRANDITTQLKKKSVLLLGPRRAGKSAFIRNELQPDHSYNLLQADTFQELSHRPSIVREKLKPSDRLVVIDEIQKLPVLMDEVHTMIEDHGVRFLITGSSARKLKRSFTSLMAGRARRRYLHPFCYGELRKNYRLHDIIERGAMPSVYLSANAEDAWDDLRDYAGMYLREEVLAEALTRKIEAFSRFLTTAALSNAQLVRYESVASDAQVPARTVREYFAILEDTLMGHNLEPFRPQKLSRKSVSTSKFYFFDLGVLNALVQRKAVNPASVEYGELFETLIFLELKAYIDAKGLDTKLNFWRSHTGQEVDFVVNDAIGIEVKATQNVSERHMEGLAVLHKQIPLKRRFIVAHDKHSRQIGGVEVLHWRDFLEMLWDGLVVG